jgi:phosphate transport system substrate-binding protein
MKYTSILVFLIIALALTTASYFLFTSPSMTGQSVAVKGTERIEIKGSDTLLQLVSNMAEEFSKDNDVRISVTGGGSGTGIAALINGEVDIADASRAMKNEEKQQARDNGIEPIEFRVARDMLSVIVHENNPVSRLTKQQIGKIFRGEITNWKQIGGPDKEITLYGRQSTSGTYAFFMENVLEDDYSPQMRNLEGNQAILEAVKQDETGIGYVGIGYILDENREQVPGINVIKVAENSNSEYVSPLDSSKLSDYAISRALYQYLSEIPEKDSAVHKFLLFEISNKGKEIVQETGFVELTDKDKAQNQEFLNKIR